MQQSKFETAFKGTFLEKVVMDFFEKEDAKCPVEEEVGENEQVIGTCLDLEKSFFLASSKIAKDNNKYVNDCEKAGKEPDDHKVHMSKSMHKRLNEIFWLLIKERIGKPATEKDAVGIRKDWQIVAIEKEKDGCPGFFKVIEIRSFGI
ncbi:MAG: hypothetical protein K9M44_03405 [Candidatus Pacebacteria bacterium]|nr:hypothetical protein [Candidatus Paceibacterota bacterium]